MDCEDVGVERFWSDARDGIWVVITVQLEIYPSCVSTGCRMASCYEGRNVGGRGNVMRRGGDVRRLSTRFQDKRTFHRVWAIFIGDVRIFMLVDWSGDEVVLGGFLVLLARREWEEWVGFRVDVAGAGIVMGHGVTDMMYLNSIWLRAVIFDVLWGCSELSMPCVLALLICAVRRYAHKFLVEMARLEPGQVRWRAVWWVWIAGFLDVRHWQHCR